MIGFGGMPAEMPQGGLAKKKSKRPQVQKPAFPPAMKAGAKKAKPKKKGAY